MPEVPKTLVMFGVPKIPVMPRVENPTNAWTNHIFHSNGTIVD